MEKETKFIVLVTVFVMALTTAIMVGSKIVSFIGLTFSAGAITYAITFPMTDVIAEVWGKKKAKTIIWAGLLTLALGALLAYISIILPPASFWTGQEAYKQTLGLAGRLVIASVAAFFVSQHHDVWAFHFWKDRTQGKHLWWRNNASTFVSQIIDTVIFVTIAFYGILPNAALLPTMFGQFVIKIGIAVIDTPVVYALVAWAKKGD
jgi:uncharacterized integral membrane protein (TIGR00697 family)